ncbi:SLC13 family permease [Konateibacter massiliensis]|uniref:SLC13 family permease n=1 Tax=Konateibacter massiliensis TaxID=2002841 RepID=UPI000C150B5E|nr:SLC13 family permease [Konateibacter massiliensis]
MKEFIKKEPVLTAAILLAALSVFIVKPSAAYIDYIDFGVLILLFCLMLVVGGLQSIGMFEFLAGYMLKFIKNDRQLYSMMVSLCFFTSMLITNDVALITFIPFTILLLLNLKKRDKLISLIVLETVAANLGSMLTPIGNPQNLYIYTISEMSIAKFVKVMLPITVISYVLLLIVIWIITRNNKKIETNMEIHKVSDKKRLLLYAVLFLLCIGAVLHLLNYAVLLWIVLAAVFLSDKNLVMKADYSLLFTFTAFFIFIGNIQHMELVRSSIQGIIKGNTILFAVLSSQVISNVPSAMLLSGFTNNYSELLLGLNIGGLGTLIASMASLISYRYYVNIQHSDTKRYIGVFTLTNVFFLVALLTAVPIVR